MAERAKVVEPKVIIPPPPPSPPPNLKAPTFFSTGSTLLDLIIGGGWAFGRVFNLVGDKSTGKTLVAIEAFANFKLAFPSGLMRYGEAEAAFDEIFANQIGFPNNVERPDNRLDTIQDFKADFYRFIEKCTKQKVPGLYILDSFDALTAEGERAKFEKSINKKPAKEGEEEKKEAGSYGTEKAKQSSELFRMLTRDAERAGVTLGIISQIRDNIGVTFGESKQRSGGHALDFYASQIVWLAHLSTINKSAMSLERAVGIEILAQCKKCKVGFPFRKAPMSILFGYGVDNHTSMLEWLKSVDAFPKPTKEEKDAGAEDRYTLIKSAIAKARKEQDYATLSKLEEELKADTTRIWKEVDSRLAPTVKKYNFQEKK